MKTASTKTHPAIVLLYLLLFTIASGSFKSIACELSGVKASAKGSEVVEAPVKKVNMPVMNPLQVLTSKFI